MQNVKKYFTEGLIQFTLLLSLVGVRVDVDSYLQQQQGGGYFFSPEVQLLEISLGPSAAYTPAPFHSLRDTLDGYTVHPKCPEVDYFFLSRRLLDEVRTLGSSPRSFPTTQLNAWLVHRVPDSDSSSDLVESSSDSSSSSSGLEGTSGGDDDGSNEEDGGGDEPPRLPGGGQEECHPDPAQQQQQQHLVGPAGPGSTGACKLLKEEDDDDVDDEEVEAASLTQLALSSTLEQESLHDDRAPLPDPPGLPPPAIDIDQHWSHFLSLPVADFDDLDPLAPGRLSDLDSDITSAISQDVSLQDAMAAAAGVYGMLPQRGGAFGMMSQRGGARPVARQRAPLFRLESTNSSDLDPGMTTGLAALPFASVCNVTNASSHDSLGSCLDEAVFDQINLLGLEGLDTIDSQMLEGLESIDPRFLQDLDSDSGLSLESSSRGPASPGTSEVSSSSSSSSSLCEEECGATGYSSEVDSLPPKGCFPDYTARWSPVDLSESVWHDHSYPSPALFRQAAVASFPHNKAIKEEPLSEEDDDEDAEDEREVSRDELRARAMCIPFSAPEIVDMPVEEFLEALEGHRFSPEQVTLLRDIRRRGKNKLAAQNCRKRKLDAITGLQEEVARLQGQRDRLLGEKQLAGKTLGAVGQQIGQLTRDVLSRLRDDSGRPLSPERYTLQCGANGRVVVQPVRRPAASAAAGSKTDKRKKDKKQ